MFSAAMDCGHKFLSRVAPPMPGDEIYCRACCKYQLVRYRSSDWRSKCVDCTYSRCFGSDRNWAVNRASNHIQKHPEHRVKVFQANNPEYWDLIQSNQDTLDMLSNVDDEIPY